jgi:hypothetical protein
MKAAEVCCLAANGETAALSPLNPHPSESGGPMKVMQWILAAVLIAVVVFIATYLKMNTGGFGTKPPPPPPPESDVTLFFPRTTSLANEKDPTGAEWETGVPGHYDFWFQNPNDVPVTVGLSYKKCTCSKVEIALESSEWKTWEAKLALYLMLTTQGSFDLLGPALTGGYEWALPEPKRDWKALVEKDEGFEVPAGATGWVRIDWSSKKIGPDQLPVELWSHSTDSGAPLTRLSVTLIFVPPAGVEPRSVDVGVISAERPQSAKRWVAAMSPTREVFTIAVAKESDPFVVCEPPLKLTEQNCRDATTKQRLRVKSGYSVPISVRERLDDGRQLDLGPFQLKVFFKTDVAEEPLEFTIKGVVEGEVTVLSPEGRIQMGIFDAAFGEVKETVLESRNLDLNLEFDKAPSFLKVELSKEPKITGGVKTWSLRVEVPNRAVTGEFPRDDNSEYRDCAIYLKIHDARTLSDQTRRIRIPVSGKASTR